MSASVDGEYYAMVLALAEAQKVQGIFGVFHEETHVIIEMDSSAAKAHVETPKVWTHETHQRREPICASRHHEPSSVSAKSWDEEQSCRRFENTRKSSSAAENDHRTKRRAGETAKRGLQTRTQQELGIFYYGQVHKPTPNLEAMKIPEAQAVVHKERDELKSLPAWDAKKVKPKAAEVQRAKKERKTTHFANLMVFSSVERRTWQTPSKHTRGAWCSRETP